MMGGVWSAENPWGNIVYDGSFVQGFGAMLAYDTTNNVMHCWFPIRTVSVNTTYITAVVKESIGSFHGTTIATAYAMSNIDKFIGFNTTSKTDGQTATITVKGGLNENQSNLTAGQQYYIADDGLLTSKRPFASLALFRAGIATASTKLLVMNDRHT